MVIFALHLETAATRSVLRSTPTHLSEQRRKEIAEVRITFASTGISVAAKLEILIPARWCLEILSALPLRSELIVCCTLLGVFQDCIGLAERLELFLCLRFFADIRMILACQLAVRFLYLVLGRLPCDPHNVVVVFVFHRIRLSGHMSRCEIYECPITGYLINAIPPITNTARKMV